MANNDNPVSKCPRCGATVAADAPDGLCPRCLIALIFVTETEIPGEPAGPNSTQEVRSLVPPVPSPEALAPHFPQLEILEVLGRGGMGAVYKARQPNLDRFVALKILLRRHTDGKGDAGFAERFAREARALARLNHPNIVAVYEYGEVGAYPFLVMEYVEGLTLRQLLQHGKLAPEEALAIVPKICEALQFAHEKGIVHRDIKPENILLDKAGQVKITDFGIAKVIRPGAPDRSLTSVKDVVGTPHYMAPEQIEKPAKVDHRADIFSLGVVFYEMLTGELPLGKFAPPSKRVQVDVRLDEVVLRTLEKEPERRYQQVSEVKTAVATIVGSGNAAAAAAPMNAPSSGTPTNKSSFVRIVEIVFKDTFTSPLAAKLINISALGFLAGLAFLGFVPLPGWQWCFGFAGFSGFFGLIGVAFLVELAARRRGNKSSDDGSGAAADTGKSFTRNPQAATGSGGPAAVPKDEPPPAPPRWSRTAVWCAMWALLFAVNWVWSYTPPGWKITNALRDALGNWAVGLVMGPLAIVAFAAPVGVTALGWMAVNRIRRSQGRLHGLALALLEGVLFPLLLVDLWLVWLCQRVSAAMDGASHPGPTGAVILGIVLALILDVILIAWLWHRIRKPLPPLPASLASAGEAADPERSWRKWIWKTVPRAALIGAVQLCLLETIFQASVHRPESTGELWYMALLSSSLAAMVWAAWPLRHARSPVAAVGGGTLALFVALCGLDAFFSMQVRPNLGLHEEVDWLSQVPGLRWGQRQQTANALWNKPLARPFAPTVETILPLDERHPVALLDLDTGRQQSRDSFAPDDEAARAWVRAEELDLAIVSGNNKITVLGLDLREGYVPVPRLVRVEELTSQAAVNYWALDRKPAKAVADLYVDKNMTGTYAFHTREGGVGFLEFAGLSDNPRGVELRYRLVQQPNASTSASSNRVSGIARTTQAVVQQQAETMVSAMKARLHLMTDQEQVVRGLLEKKLALAGELSAKMTEGASSKEEMEKADRKIRDLDRQLKGILTPEQWVAYETSQVEERRTQAQLAANVEVMQLQPVLQLSQNQRAQVLQTLTRLHQQQLAQSYEGLKIPLDWEQQLVDIKDALQPVLSAEQLQGLEKWLDLQRETIRLTLSRLTAKDMSK